MANRFFLPFLLILIMEETLEQQIKRLEYCRDCIDRTYQAGQNEYDRLEHIIKELKNRNMNEEYLNENSREFKAAKELEHALNDYGWNEKRFAIAVTTFHRPLQQTLFRSMVEVIKIMGSEGYGYDLRNKYSHEICKKIVESGVLDDKRIPFI